MMCDCFSWPASLKLPSHSVAIHTYKNERLNNFLLFLPSWFVFGIHSAIRKRNLFETSTEMYKTAFNFMILHLFVCFVYLPLCDSCPCHGHWAQSLRALLSFTFCASKQTIISNFVAILLQLYFKVAFCYLKWHYCLCIADYCGMDIQFITAKFTGSFNSCLKCNIKHCTPWCFRLYHSNLLKKKD